MSGYFLTQWHYESVKLAMQVHPGQLGTRSNVASVSYDIAESSSTAHRYEF